MSVCEVDEKATVKESLTVPPVEPSEAVRIAYRFARVSEKSVVK
jgi:hypothetical protein